MLGKVIYKNKVINLFWIMVSLIVLSACAPEIFSPAVDSKGRRYNSENLAKDWRENSRANRPQMVYPADNDEEYYAPKYNAPLYAPTNQNQPPRKAQQPDRQSQQKYESPRVKVTVQQIYSDPSYTEDADENYSTGYPRYDPDEDNSSYYYQNMNKPLPKPVDDGSGNYNYPIYFD